MGVEKVCPTPPYSAQTINNGLEIWESQVRSA